MKTNTKKNAPAKLTEEQLAEARSRLCKTILEIKELNAVKDSLKGQLEPDYTRHEAQYRKGFVTENGILILKPKFEFRAEPKVEEEV